MHDKEQNDFGFPCMHTNKQIYGWASSTIHINIWLMYKCGTLLKMRQSLEMKY